MHELIALVTAHGALLVFAATLAARIGAPVPAAPFLVIAASLSAAFPASLLWVFGVSIIASTLGDGAWFLAGRRYGYRMLKVLCRISMSPDSCVSQSESFFERWGGTTLVAAKFVPGISVIAPPIAGVLKMPALVFLGYEMLASAIWAGLLMALGLMFSDQVQAVLDALSTMGIAAFAALAVVVAGYLAMRYWRRRTFLASMEIPRISVHALYELMEGGRSPVIIDVRSDVGRSIDTRRIPGALEIALDDIRKAAHELSTSREIILYCNCPNEASAAVAAKALVEAGHTTARPLAGGLEAWIAAGHRIDHRGPAAATAEQQESMART